MGGGHQVTNTTLAAEFNIWADPEAAQIVLSYGTKVTFVPLDTDYAVYVTANESEEIRVIGTQAARATAGLIDQRVKACNLIRTLEILSVAALHDALALLAAIDYSILRDVRFARINVDISGGFADGRTIIDNRSITDHAKNAYIALDADRDKFINMLKGYLELSKNLY